MFGPPSLEKSDSELQVEANEFAAKQERDTLRGSEAASLAEVGDLVELSNFSKFWEASFDAGLAAQNLTLCEDEDGDLIVSPTTT